MNTQTQEALKMAIKVIENLNYDAFGYFPDECANNEAIKACKEALEQPCQDLNNIKELLAQRNLELLEVQGKLLKVTLQKDVLERDYNFMRDLAIGLEEALEQPAQEPVGEYQIDGSVKWHTDVMSYKAKLYTHPHQWQGLTAEEIENYWLVSLKEKAIGGEDWVLYFARAIEQALKEKNHAL